MLTLSSEPINPRPAGCENSSSTAHSRRNSQTSAVKA